MIELVSVLRDPKRKILGYRFDAGRGKKYDMNLQTMKRFLKDINEEYVNPNLRTELLYLRNGEYVTYSEIHGGKRALDVDEIGYERFLEMYMSSWRGDPYYRSLHRKYNREYFNGELSDIPVFANNTRGTAGGLCIARQRSGFGEIRIYIEVCTVYVSKYPEELESILVHEMIHQYLFEKGYINENHGPRFVGVMDNLNRRYGLNLSLRTLHASPKPFKLLLRCIRCGSIYKQKRNINADRYKCGMCRGELEAFHRGEFYSAVKCRGCKEIFVVTEFEDLGQNFNCPNCGTKIHINKY